MAPKRHPRACLFAEALPRLGIGEILVTEGFQDIDFLRLVGVYEIGHAQPRGTQNVIDLILLANDVATFVGGTRRRVSHIGIRWRARTQVVTTQVLALCPTQHSRMSDRRHTPEMSPRTRSFSRQCRC